MVGQRQMPQHHRTTAHRAMFPDDGAASHPGTPCQGAVGTNANVVSDLHQVVDLHTVFNDCVVQRATVHTGIGTQFNVIANAHGTQLLDFGPGPAVWGEAKTIGTHHHTWVKNAAVTHHAPMPDGDTGVEMAVGTQLSPRFYHDVTVQTGLTGHHGSGPDVRHGANGCIGCNTGRRIDHC